MTRSTRFAALLLAGAALACGQLVVPTATPGATPQEASPDRTPAPVVCMDQMAWEPHEGEYTGDAFAASRALEPLDAATGASEALAAGAALQAMSDLALGPNARVADLLRAAAQDLAAAAAAFSAGDAARARQWLADAELKHVEALSSTTAEDWCR